MQIVTGLVHAGSMVAGLEVLGVPYEVSLPVAAVTATGLWQLDRLVLRAADDARATAIMESITPAGEARTPIRTRIGRSLAHGRAALMRIGVSLVTSTVLAGFVALRIFSAEIESVILERQVELDAPLLQTVNEAFDVEAGALEATRLRAVHALETVDAAYADARERHGQAVERLEARIDDLRDDVERHERRAEDAFSRAAAQRDVARCEVGGDETRCEEFSGERGVGRLSTLATGRADAAEEEARRHDALARRARVDLAEVEERLAALGLIMAEDDAALTQAQDRLRQAEAAISQFAVERENRAVIVVAENPKRVVLDPHSLALRLDAHEELWSQRSYAVAAIAIKLLALALELERFTCPLNRKLIHPDCREGVGLDGSSMFR